MVGQQTAISAARRALSNGMQSIIFYGNSGVGKTTLARICAGKLRADRVNEVDAATYSGVDDMRELIAPYAYHMTGVHVIIIDECQRLSQAAWTVLLKAIEDSPKGLYWFLVTTDLAKVLKTIITRSAPIHLEDVGQNDILTYLERVCDKERLDTPDAVLGLVARESQGSPRRALSLLSMVSDCDTREQAARIIRVVDEEDPSQIPHRWAQALVTPLWSELQKIFAQARAKDVYPETIRRVVYEYFSKVAETSKDERKVCYALGVMDHFADEVTTISQLVHCTGRVVYGGK
jgi:DNA polymerase III gamma/tau subunit